MTEKTYVAYLLRLWRVSSGRGMAWRASLQSAHTGQSKGFATLDELFDFLRQQTDGSPDPGESATGQWSMGEGEHRRVPG